MKILLFTNSLGGGGAERVVASLANHWAGRGWRVSIVTIEPARADFHRLDPGVERIALDLGRPSRGALDALSQNLRRIIALRRVLAAARPDVALALMSTPNVLLAFASLGMARMRTVGSERCYPPHHPLGRVWTALRRRMYRRLDALVAQTRESAAWIRAHCPAQRVPVIPNAALWPLPQHLPRIAPQDMCLPRRRILLAVGRLEPVKNFGALVEVFRRIAPAHPEWDLVILGEGAQRPALEAAAGAALGAGRIRLPGIAGNVGDWYARADLYVLCSHSEGFPNCLAEALAHGLPAVSVDCDTGPRDIVRHGVDGLLVAPGDGAALGLALERLMEDPGLRSRFAARACEARERFSLERVAGMWEALFRDLHVGRRT
ncbi:glycosyltransferase family 4 protein [Massilia sp. 9I]|uniref:glycosyltransferase family 4 protein n=1 Tax=Massilia sp. 9I TaxID=2653152 RepID=UPI0012F0ADE0|nr:glycosyltransferase family 4 protein [Massilia sp. 9I]VXB89026.1 Glycosyl transferase, group 1 family protein [Massilia sp. 9I]